MRDVIQMIMATENEAKTMVESARAEAERIMSEARKKGQDLIERARQEARLEGQQIVRAALEVAELEKEKNLALIRAQIARDIQLDDDSRRSAVEGIVRCVCELR